MRVDDKLEIVMRWLYSMNGTFVIHWREKKASPLVLLNHFVLSCRRLAFLVHAGHLAGLINDLDTQHSHWFEWSAEQIQRRGFVDQGELLMQKMAN